MGIASRIIRNVLGNWANYFASLIISFFMMPFVIYHLGDTAYGIWILIGSLTGYLGLLDLGISSAIVKYTAQLRARREQYKINEFASTSFFTYSFIGLLAFCISIIIALFFMNFFHINSQYLKLTKWIVIIVGLDVALSFPLGVFGGLIRGSQRYDLNAFVELGTLIIRTILILIFLSQGFGLFSLAIISVFTKIAAHVWRSYYACRLIPQLKINFRLFQRKRLKMIFNYGIYSFIIAIAAKLAFYTDSVVIGLFLSASAITYYSIAGRLIEYLRQIVGESIYILVPTVSEFDAKEEFKKIRRLLIVGTKFSLLIALPVGAIFIVMGKSFITLWMGARYAERAAPVLTILMTSQFMALSQFTSGAILYGINRHKFSAITGICEALANLILSIVLVRHYGIIGVALGTAVPLMITSTFILPVYTCRKIGLPVASYLKKGFLSPLLAVIPFLSLVIYFTLYFHPDTWSKFMTQVGICSVIFVISSWHICFTPNERNSYMERIKSFLKVKLNMSIGYGV